MRLHFFLAFLFVLPVCVRGQSDVDTQPEVVAVFAVDAPRIDGELDDAIWQDINPITSFRQRDPAEGERPTEESELRIAYDRDHLYFAFTFLDKEPDRIRANVFDRGGRIDKDDRVLIGLDTYLDSRNAYIFEINPLGTQDDALLTDERSLEWSWDCVYFSEGKVTDIGWTLEVAIPFNQIRFPDGEEIEMGVAVQRTINRKNETVIWPWISRDYSQGILQVSRYATLRGLRNLRKGRHVEIKPYVLTGGQKRRGDESTDSDFVRDAGVDVKYGISSNMTLDLTLNTDFAQVEADNVQINLTRFNLFFPEKREFFLERAGLFSFGASRRAETFFSRRIGIDNDILAGARITGQSGPVSFGALNIQTKQEEGVRGSNFGVARMRADVLPRTTVGGILTSLEREGGYNRAGGFDFATRFWGNSEVVGWLTNVWSSDENEADAAGELTLDLRRDLWSLELGYLNVGRRFSPGLGFVRRRDMIRYDGDINYRPLIGDGAGVLRRLLLSVQGELINGHDGRKQSSETEIDAVLLFRTRDAVGFEVERSFEQLDEPFFIRSDVEIPVDDYTFDTFIAFVGTDQSRRGWTELDFAHGGFFGGDRTILQGAAGFRFSKYFKAESEVQHTIISLPVENGDFSATTVGMNLRGATGRKLFANALIQYDNFSKDLVANIRVDWIHTPGSDLFFVFNTGYSFEDRLTFRESALLDRVAVAKVTYLVRL